VTRTVAIAGKGGVGKTLVCGLLVRHLSEGDGGPLLAVDADPNANLHEVLGLDRRQSVGAIREELKAVAADVPGGMSKGEFLEYKLESALAEEAGFDLLVMGRPEGPGCYCYANNLLRDLLGRIAGRYGRVLIDNEAGMEHLSRRLLSDLDLLLVVSDPTVRGLLTAQRIAAVPDEVETRVRAKALLVNRVSDEGLSPQAHDLIEAGSLPLLGCLPEDPQVRRCDEGRAELSSLFPDSRLARAVAGLVPRFGPEGGA